MSNDLNFHYQETKELRNLLNKLEALKIVIDTLKPLPNIELNLRRQSVLKSSLFSARIEGNPLTISEVKLSPVSKAPESKEKQEVYNLLRAYNFICSKRAPKKLSANLIKKFHQLTMLGISKKAGQLRKEPGAIFNQDGVAIYLSPPYTEIPELIKKLVKFSSSSEFETPVKAAITHFLFEKIHPFADGNGRVGRLISSFIMYKGSYGFKGIVASEEIIEKKREEYYQVLLPKKDATDFVIFFLHSHIQQAQKVINKLQEKENGLPEDVLLPRRREILEIVRDHPYCTFNFIARRFLAVNPKTLHYDIKKLQDEKFIIKVGKTRGVCYKAS